MPILFLLWVSEQSPHTSAERKTPGQESRALRRENAKLGQPHFEGLLGKSDACRNSGSRANVFNRTPRA